MSTIGRGIRAGFTRSRKVRAICMLSILAAGCSNPAQEDVTTSPEEFQSFVLEYLHQPGVLPEAARGEDAREIVAGDTRLGLDNVQLKCRLAGGTRAACLPVLDEHFVGILERLKVAEAEEALPVAELLSRLRLQFATEDYLQSVPEGTLWTRWAPGVLKAVVLDGPDSYSYLSRDQSRKWQMSEDEVWARAEREFERTSVDTLFEDAASAGERIVFVFPDDGYAAARILLPAFRARAAEALGEPFFAALPHRDALVLWANDADPAVTARLLETVAEDYRTSPYALSPSVFRVTKDDVVPLPAETGSGPGSTNARNHR